MELDLTILKEEIAKREELINSIPQKENEILAINLELEGAEKIVAELKNKKSVLNKEIDEINVDKLTAENEKLRAIIDFITNPKQEQEEVAESVL